MKPSLKDLRRLVPSATDEECSEALQATGGNIERAAAALLKKRRVTAEAQQHEAATARAASSAPPTTGAARRRAAVTLTPQQAALVERVRRGENVFITGEAGTGKSVVTRAITKLFHPDDIAMTAPTGIAALNIDGLTIHSWAGVGYGRGETQELIDAVMKSRKASRRWRETQLLIIDEVSMLTDRLFQSLSDIGAAVRSQVRGKDHLAHVPFGGMQIVCVGDFCQLPPVGSGYCFATTAWKRVFGQKAAAESLLTTQLRQADDARFAALLNELRRGVLSPGAHTDLLQCHISVKPKPLDGIIATKLYCTNRNVDMENAQQLRLLRSAEFSYTALDKYSELGSWNREKAKEDLKMLANKKVQGKVSLQVQVLFMITYD